MEDTNRKLWHRKAEDDDLNDPFSPPLPFAISFVKEETLTCIVELGNYVEHEFVYSRLLSQLRDLPNSTIQVRVSSFTKEMAKGSGGENGSFRSSSSAFLCHNLRLVSSIKTS
jgi:hypothetical protein